MLVCFFSIFRQYKKRETITHSQSLYICYSSNINMSLSWSYCLSYINNLWSKSALNVRFLLKRFRQDEDIFHCAKYWEVFPDPTALGYLWNNFMSILPFLGNLSPSAGNIHFANWTGIVVQSVSHTLYVSSNQRPNASSSFLLNRKVFGVFFIFISIFLFLYIFYIFILLLMSI